MSAPFVPVAPFYAVPPIPPSDRTTAMLAYILGLFTSLLGPLILFLVNRGRSKFVAFHALQALLLHAVLLAGYALSVFLMYFLIGFVIYPMFFVLGLVLSVVVGVAANRGEWFEIPLLGPVARRLVGR